MSLGQRIEGKRLDISMSQTELANKIETSPTMISLYESNKRKPSYQKLELISFFLNTTVDYLMSGNEDNTKDPISRKIMLSLKTLNNRQKNQIYDYICHITGTHNFNYDIPVGNTPEDFASYLVEKKDLFPPIDLSKLIDFFDVKLVYHDKNQDENEGLLIKSGLQPIILMDKSVNNFRQRFTIAMLLGNLIMPWHLHGIFYRAYSKSSSDVEELYEIESREFASSLLMPIKFIKSDFKNLQFCYEDFEQMAHRYHVSVTALIKRYQKIKDPNIVFIRINNNEIHEVNKLNFHYPLNNYISPNSLAGKLNIDMPKIKTTISGELEADIWLNNVDDGKKIYETSCFDPTNGWTMTVLKLL